MRVDALPRVSDASLRLRHLERDDVEEWNRYLSAPGSLAHSGRTPTCSVNLMQLVASCNSTAPDSPIRFAIVEAANGRLVGSIGFHTISMQDKTAEIAFDVNPVRWGRGIATTCCRALTDYGFTELGFVRIQATALDTNMASVRVLEKCRYHREGTLRAYRIVMNRPRDFFLYARLTSDG